MIISGLKQVQLEMSKGHASRALLQESGNSSLKNTGERPGWTQRHHRVDELTREKDYREKLKRSRTVPQRTPTFQR